MEARYDERLRACKSVDEAAEYILSCIPIIKEYTAEATEETVTNTVASMQVTSRKGVPRQDIYKKYLSEIENESHETRRALHEAKCRNCGCKYSKVLDEALSEEICQECGVSEFFLGDEVGYKEEQEHLLTKKYAP